MNRIIRPTFRWALSFILTAVAIAGAWGQSISIDRYFNRNAQGGVGLQAHYDLGPNWDNDCCDPANIRWLQRIVLLDANGNVKNNVGGYPNGDFIDPSPNQPGGPWDNDPWYDVSYNNAAHTGGIQGGKGRWMEDFPTGWGPFGKMSFNAQTMVVCTDPQAKIFCYLGGFTWGFNVAANGTIGQQPIGALADGAGLRANVNAAINRINVFKPWTMVACTEDCPEFTVSTVPEPASLSVLGLALLGLRARRRSKRA